MKINLMILSFLMGFQIFAQENFPVRISNFSDVYQAEIDLNFTDREVTEDDYDRIPSYIIRVSEKNSGKILIEMESYNFPDYLINEAGEAVANIWEIPYGSQSVLIYDDFNFDEVKDIALMNGYMSCYGGPSFDVYLAKGNEFVYHEEFSRLGNEYCGFFSVDYETKIIHTMTKSTCCWHQFSEFKVENDEPIPIRIVERSFRANNGFNEITETIYKNGKEKITAKTYMFTEDYGDDIIFTFQLEKNEKDVVIFRQGDRLYYALLRKDGEVEFFYPEYFYDENGKELNEKFVYTQNKTGLSFTNEDAQYEVYETEKTVGVIVKTKGKTYNLKGIKSTALGSIELYEHLYTNVINQ